jgi:HEAT repeat-containing protein 5
MLKIPTSSLQWMAEKSTNKIRKLLQLPIAKNQPHCHFFFIIFGLVYEAIATASADVSSESRSGVISALTALKFLVRPEYSGQAIMEPTIFEEFISLCYRMGMTEAAGIQIHLIEMLAIFAATQQHSGSTGLDVLSLMSPPTHCLRSADLFLYLSKPPHLPMRAVLISLTLSPVLLRDWKVHTDLKSQPSDRIAVISSAIAAFTSIANSITSSQRGDVRSVAVLLYTMASKTNFLQSKFQLIFFNFQIY